VRYARSTSRKDPSAASASSTTARTGVHADEPPRDSADDVLESDALLQLMLGGLPRRDVVQEGDEQGAVLELGRRARHLDVHLPIGGEQTALGDTTALGQDPFAVDRAAVREERAHRRAFQLLQVDAEHLAESGVGEGERVRRRVDYRDAVRRCSQDGAESGLRRGQAARGVERDLGSSQKGQHEAGGDEDERDRDHPIGREPFDPGHVRDVDAEHRHLDAVTVEEGDERCHPRAAGVNERALDEGASRSDEDVRETRRGRGERVSGRRHGGPAAGGAVHQVDRSPVDLSEQVDVRHIGVDDVETSELGTNGLVSRGTDVGRDPSKGGGVLGASRRASSACAAA
jgi:hypothetical protein